MDEGDGGEEDEDTGGRDLLGFPRACLLDSLPSGPGARRGRCLYIGRVQVMGSLGFPTRRRLSSVRKKRAGLLIRWPLAC